jgi:murein DD-endopeptidase MepM/ murein hydrolase activator NlpD
MKLKGFVKPKIFNRNRRQKISQLSFSEMRIAEKKSVKNRVSGVVDFVTNIPKYLVKKWRKFFNFLTGLVAKSLTLTTKIKGFVTIKLIWGRGRLARPFIYFGTLILIISVFLTGGVFQKNLIVLSSAEQDVFVASSSDIVPQPILVSTAEPNTKFRETVVTHTVKSGDTLSSIGKKYGVTVDTIRYANNISDTGYLKVGQDLSIPPINGVVYEVEANDTIDSIAEEYGIAAQAIADFNYLAPPFNLKTGDELVLPNADIPQPVPAVVVAPPSNNAGQYGGSDYTFVPNAGSGASGSGSFAWPTPSRLITQYFSWYHPAIDIAVPGPIVAADSGVVVRSGWWANGYGFAVQIDHRNGFVTTYAHMSTLDVSVGQDVGKGQKIGYMGSTGRSTGPHVHFTIQRNGQFLNPLEFY